MSCRNAICAMLVVLGLSVSAVAAIPMGAEKFTAEQARKINYECLRRLMSQAYAEAHPDPTELDRRAMLFLDDIARRDAGYRDGKSVEALERIGRELYIDGCDDPLVIAVHAMVRYDFEEYTQSIPVIEQSVGALADSGYSPYLRARVLEKLIRHAVSRQNKDRIPELLRQFVPAVQEVITRQEFGVEEQSLLYGLLAGAFDDYASLGYLEIFNDWLAESAEADPWLVQMVAGHYHFKTGWRARGHGWASQVTSDGWEKFHTHLEESRRYFELAWHANPAFPESAAYLVGLKRGHHDGDPAGEMREWLDRAVSSRFDQPRVYEMFMSGMLPRWHGSHEEILAFGIECAETRRYDTDVPLQLVTALKTIRNDGGGTRFWRQQNVYDQVRQVLQGYIDEPSQQYRRDYFLTLMAGFAHLNNRWDDAAEALDDLNDKLDKQAAAYIEMDLHQFVGEVRLRTNPDTADAFKSAERLNAQGKWLEAIDAYRTLQTLPMSPAEKQYLDECLWLRHVENGARNGEWTSLTFDENLSGWRLQSGYWTRENDGAVIGVANHRGLMLRCAAYLGKRFEVRGRFEFIGPADQRYGTGFFMWSPAHDMVFQMAIAPPRGISRMYNFFDERRDDPATGLDPVVNQLHLVVDRNQCSGFVNEQELYKPHTPANFPSEGFNYLGIGGMYHYRGTAVRISELQIRRIK